MKRIDGSTIALGLSIMLVMFSIGFVANASDTMPAAKASAQVTDMTVLEVASNSPASTGWVPIFTTTMKTANQKDLFVDVSLQSGLYTDTTVKSKNMKSDTSTATAGVTVRVLVDGEVAKPGEVIFNYREQELSATLQGQIDLVDKNNNGVIEEGELEVVSEEEISLLLHTISANSFNFLMPNVESGIHTITVEAQIDVDSTQQEGSAEAKAILGAGSVTVEEVRMINGSGVELTSP